MMLTARGCLILPVGKLDHFLIAYLSDLRIDPNTHTAMLMHQIL